MRFRDSPLSSQRERLPIPPLHSKGEAAEPPVLAQLVRVRRDEPVGARRVRCLEIVEPKALDESFQMHVPSHPAERLVSPHRGLGLPSSAKPNEPIRLSPPGRRVRRAKHVPASERSLYRVARIQPLVALGQLNERGTEMT